MADDDGRVWPGGGGPVEERPDALADSVARLPDDLREKLDEAGDNARMLLNLMVIAGASLIRGGTLSVRVTSPVEGEKHLQLTAAGETIKLDAETAEILKTGGDSVQLTPKTSQPFLTMKLAQEVGATIAYSIEGNSLDIRVVQKQMALASVG